MGNRVDLSVVITAHSEGLIAHKTMRSVLEALEKVEKVGYGYEIIVHIDNGDIDTRNYFARYKDDERIKVFENRFGDTAPSRNFAIDKARGEYVAILDGDDLISDNYCIQALRVLEESNEEIVVHPEIILTFGIDQPNVLTRLEDSFEDEKDALILLGENRWTSSVVAKKSTFQKVPYRLLKNGYGHEDYVFNIETIQKGIKHKVARETIFFYRRSEGSRLSSAQHEHAIIPKMELFDFERIKKMQQGISAGDAKTTLKQKGYKVYKKIRNNNKINYFITPVAKATLKVLEHTSSRARKDGIPKFVIDGWIKMNHIDSQLYPYKETLKRVQFYWAERQVGVGNAYLKLARAVTAKPDYVFIVPWIVRGGADKVMFNYIRALKEIHPDWHFAVIATLPAKNAWAKDLPEGVDFLDFGNVSLGLTPDMQDTLMSRVITQLGCKRLHIINSEFGYNWVRKHKSLVGKNYKLNVSLFVWEYVPGSEMRAVYSYDNPYLFEIFDVVKHVFTDNKAIINYATENNGFTADKFIVHYQPTGNMKMGLIKRGLVNPGKLRLLWAGRVAPQKMPSVLVEIGRKLNSGEVIIDTYGEIDKDISRGIFDGVGAIRYCGAYDGFSSLPTDKYDALIYTSLYDGLPNVILEATAAGLPVIASNDGGVGEFIKDGETGVLIRDYLNPDAYVDAIKKVMAQPEVLQRYVKNAQKLLQEQHSWQSFVADVKRDID